MKSTITIEALSAFMGLRNKEPWPIYLIEQWIIRNKKHFSERLLHTGKLTYRQAMVTAIGCFLDCSYSSADTFYDKYKNANDGVLIRPDIDASGQDSTVNLI